MISDSKKFKAEHPKSFKIQVIGCRGVGKSTFVTKVLKALDHGGKASTGTEETTVETQFFDISSQVELTGFDYEEVFLVDQPGIGGLVIKESEYLE